MRNFCGQGMWITFLIQMPLVEKSRCKCIPAEKLEVPIFILWCWNEVFSFDLFYDSCYNVPEKGTILSYFCNINHIAKIFFIYKQGAVKNTLREFSIVRFLDFKGPGGFPSGPLAVCSLFIHLFLFSSLFFSWKLLPRRR